MIYKNKMSTKSCPGQFPELQISGEFGELQSGSRHVTGENQYFIYLQVANKYATERWYPESQLVAVEDDRSRIGRCFCCLECLKMWWGILTIYWVAVVILYVIISSV
jgi:hypothetical protein